MDGMLFTRSRGHNVGSLSAVSYAFTYSGMPLTIIGKEVTYFTFTYAYK